jgi:MHS family proline/betaine transporter-like MFS transporter
MNQDRSIAIFAGQAGFGALFGLAYGGIPALMSELLPTQVRCTAIGTGYNLALGIFGGTAPLVATYVVARTANDYVPAYYLIAVSAISFVAALGLPETGEGEHRPYKGPVENPGVGGSIPSLPTT